MKSAAKIDKTNTTTLRFLREVEQQTGKITNLEPRFKAREKVKQEKEGRVIYRSGNDVVIQPMEYRERTVTNTLINLIIGLLVGASALWFLVVPAQNQRINQKANQKVVEYSDKVATQAAELTRLQEEIDNSSESVNTATDQISQAKETTTSYENLLKAWQAYNDENYETAANALEGVNSDLLSVEAKSMYDAIMGDIGSSVKQKYQSTAMDAYESGDYATAIENYTKALDIGEPDFTSMFYLAQAYQKSGDTDNAKTWYQKIIDTFPGTQNASDAQDYLDALTGEVLLLVLHNPVRRKVRQIPRIIRTIRIMMKKIIQKRMIRIMIIMMKKIPLMIIMMKITATRMKRITVILIIVKKIQKNRKIKRETLRKRMDTMSIHPFFTKD